MSALHAAQYFCCLYGLAEYGRPVLIDRDHCWLWGSHYRA